MVEQGTENPRVGSSILSLATTPRSLLPALLLLGCGASTARSPFEDDCEATCRVTADALDDCGVVWSDLDADDEGDWRGRCMDEWSSMRLQTSELERDQALESCEGMLEWVEASTCEELLDVYGS